MSDERKEAITGLWRLASGLEIDIELADGTLRATPDGQPTFELVPTSDSTLTISGVEASLAFRFEADGSTDEATLRQNGETAMSRVVDTGPPTEEALRVYEGRYWSDEMQVAFELRVEDGALVADNIRLPSITLEAGAADTFSAGGVGTLEFRRSGNGRVTGFMVNNDRTKDVWFERAWAPGR